jgi:hypothetical protein
LSFVLANPVQLIQFLNMVYLSYDPNNTDVYDCKDISMKQILSTVWEYSDIFNDKNTVSFGKWCSNNNVELMKSKTKRKYNGNKEKISTRSLYVLKQDYIGKEHLVLLESCILMQLYR